MLHFTAIVVNSFFPLIVTATTQTQSPSVPNNIPSLATLPVMAECEKVTRCVIYDNVQFSRGSRLAGWKWQFGSEKRGSGRQ